MSSVRSIDGSGLEGLISIITVRFLSIFYVSPVSTLSRLPSKSHLLFCSSALLCSAVFGVWFFCVCVLRNFPTTDDGVDCSRVFHACHAWTMRTLREHHQLPLRPLSTPRAAFNVQTVQGHERYISLAGVSESIQAQLVTLRVLVDTETINRARVEASLDAVSASLDPAAAAAKRAAAVKKARARLLSRAHIFTSVESAVKAFFYRLMFPQSSSSGGGGGGDDSSVGVSTANSANASANEEVISDHHSDDGESGDGGSVVAVAVTNNDTTTTTTTATTAAADDDHGNSSGGGEDDDVAEVVVEVGDGGEGSSDHARAEIGGASDRGGEPREENEAEASAQQESGVAVSAAVPDTDRGSE